MGRIFTISAGAERKIKAKSSLRNRSSFAIPDHFSTNFRADLLPRWLRLDEPHPLDAAEVSSLIEPGGAFSRYFSDFEYRPQQVAMLQAVTEAFSQSRHLLVEAGTGTGKSMAYLIPAALWAVKNNKRVVISTNTINLQDQLINKDIPDLRAVLGLNIEATVMKGRGNYLCPRRFESMRRRGPELRMKCGCFRKCWSGCKAQKPATALS